ncbi:MAG TPA: RNA polymerase sigma factor [Longimicrobiaceae bacterium]|nr:RNA polymerase sigma factor [Longimicrobiaceae bacterium]
MTERPPDAGRAFERLYEQHVDRVYGLCLRMSGNVDEAEQLTQDVFVRAWSRLASFRGESAFGSWLYRLAVNVVLHARRTEGRRAARMVPTGGVEELEHAAARRVAVDERLDLERAIATLPPRARLVLVLHDVEGYPQPEVAGMTGMALGTVKSQLHRARRLLRERLER